MDNNNNNKGFELNNSGSNSSLHLTEPHPELTEHEQLSCSTGSPKHALHRLRGEKILSIVHHITTYSLLKVSSSVAAAKCSSCPRSYVLCQGAISENVLSISVI